MEQGRKKILIVDDEPDARKNLTRLLSEWSKEIEIVGEAGNAEEARQKLAESEGIDLIFLDIAMPRETGFDFLRSIPSYNGEIIFITSFNDYAEKAFKYFALGYLTKPIDHEEFQGVLNHTLSIIDLKKTKISYDQLVGYFEPTAEASKNLVVPTSEGHEIIKRENILYIEGQRNYSKIVCHERQLMVSRNLSMIAALLNEKDFMRIHKSYVVQVSKVRKITYEGTVILINGAEIRIAQKYREEFIKRLSNE